MRLTVKARRLAGAMCLAVTAATGAGTSVAASATLPPGSIPVPTSGTFLYLNSEPGDWVGGGVEQLFTVSEATFNASLPPGGTSFWAAVDAYSGSWWHIEIAAPWGEPLLPGSYPGATRAPFRGPEEPGLDIGGEGRGCNTVNGSFEVSEVSHAPTGELLVFDAVFEQHCEGAESALFGRIRIENPPPPPDVTPPTLYLPSELRVEAQDNTGTTVNYYGEYAIDDRDPSPQIACTPPAGSFFPVGTTTVTCRATDASGNTAEGSFPVHVLEPLRLAVAAIDGFVRSNTGVAVLSGTVSCSRSLPLYVSGTLRQLFANRVYVTGSFSLHVQCTAASTPWTVEVTSQNGKFAAGAADVESHVLGCDISCRSASSTASLRLRAAR